MTMMAMNIEEMPDKKVQPERLAQSGILPGLGAMMEVAGIESIPGAQVSPKMVGYVRDES